MLSEHVMLSAGPYRLADMKMYPMEIGKAAEHLVCTDLICMGYRAMLSDQGLPYDILVEITAPSRGMVRLQVKGNAVRRASDGGYQFKFHRNNRKSLTSDDCDIVACVALDIGKISYFPLHKIARSRYFKKGIVLGHHGFQEAVDDHIRFVNSR